MAKVSVLGAGGWGLALALTLYSNQNDVTVWSPFENEVNELLTKRTNERLLKGVILPKEIKITNNLADVSGSAITVIATPSFAVRETAQKLKEIKNLGIIVNVSKGLEKGSLKRLSQIISEELPTTSVVVLSGPSHAEEVARKIPTMLTAASDDMDSAAMVQRIFSNEFLRVYTNTDVVGVELGGALKNVIAVCAGLCDGMGLGDNSKAALITRGLAEMIRLGIAMGAQSSTFSGLTGLGDLIVTCTSKHSRNNRFGNLVGRGVAVEDALNEVGTVEGYYACKMAYELSQKYGISAAIITTCYELLYNGRSTQDIVKELMTRPFKEE